MAATFVLREDVDFALGLLVGMDALRSAQALTALDAFLFNTTEEETDVVASLTLVEHLAEHLDASDDGRGGVLEADDFDGLTDFADTALDTTRGNGAAAGDREDVLDGHQEGLVGLASGLGDLGVDGVHQLADRSNALGLAFEGRRGGTANDLGVVAVKVVLAEELTDFHLDEVEELFVVDEVDLVEEHHDLRHADLAGEEDVLTGLGHRAVSGRNHEDGAVHLGSTGDHVLDEVSVSRAVDVRIVALVALVFHVGHGDRHDLGRVAEGTALSDISVGLEFSQALISLNLQNGGGQGRFTVVNVADGANVYVRFLAFECAFSHVV